MSPEDVRAEELEAISQLMRDYPSHPDPIYLMGKACEAQGKTEEAVKYWEQCTKIFPGGVQAYIGMATIADNLGGLQRSHG